VKESFTMRQICNISGYSKAKIARIKNYWLEQSPPVEEINFKDIKYILYDGTYFHQDGCLICVMNAKNQKLLSNIYRKKEGYKSCFPMFSELKEQGLNPMYITMDGEQSVMRVIREIWPETKIQRCLYHIQSEGMRWLRSKPKTRAGIELRSLLKTICCINTERGRAAFVSTYANWLQRHRSFVLGLPKNNVAYKDLKKTMSLINNAIPDMFHYLEDENIHRTTNMLEGFFSRVKPDYVRHRGLTKTHKLSYLNWYCYFNNEKKNNTL
jgi:hypothetical protein